MVRDHMSRASDHAERVRVARRSYFLGFVNSSELVFLNNKGREEREGRKGSSVLCNSFSKVEQNLKQNLKHGEGTLHRKPLGEGARWKPNWGFQDSPAAVAGKSRRGRARVAGRRSSRAGAAGGSGVAGGRDSLAGNRRLESQAPRL